MPNNGRPTDADASRGLELPRTGPDTSPSADPGPDAARADVVRRLLERGISPEALRTMLPNWLDLIEQVSTSVTSLEDASPPR